MTETAVENIKTQPSFTPGPWDCWTEGPHVRVTDVAGTRHSIATVVCGPELKANANLISAAPDMFEVLSRLVEGNSGVPHFAAAAALAKARGETRGGAPANNGVSLAMINAARKSCERVSDLRGDEIERIYVAMRQLEFSGQ